FEFSTNTLALLTQSYKTYLPQTNNQLQISSNPRNQATIQDGKVVIRMFRVNRIEDIRTMHGVRVQLVMRELRIELGGQDNVVDDDVDEQPIQDLALNVDNVFQADDCDAFDPDVNEAPTAQTMFMANLLSAYLVYDKVGLFYDSHVLSETKVVVKSLTAELATYKEQVELYERRARFELTKIEQKIDE
nr:hypothetical protein [Tanacetum cinerariifolium]